LRIFKWNPIAGRSWKTISASQGMVDDARATLYHQPILVLPKLTERHFTDDYAVAAVKLPNI